MRKLFAIIPAVALVAAACADQPTEPHLAPVDASLATWTDKVSGGADLSVGSCTFIISASVSATDQDGVRGQMQIKAVDGTGVYPECVPAVPEVVFYQFHGEVDGLLTGSLADGQFANVCGEITKGQGEGYGETGAFAPGSRFALAIKDAASGADRLRVRTGVSLASCLADSGTFPAIAFEGGYNVRNR